MSEPIQDRETVTPSGERIDPLPDGVTVRDLVTHADVRGTTCELYDPRWGWHPDPLVFAYFFTVRPGMVKGWGLHLEHDDRYALLQGEMEVVLYDPRPESSTTGLVATVVLSEHHRRLLSIPAGIWHADRNIGSVDVVAVNFPTIQYDHASPDKYRLPLDTDQIPYEFEHKLGW